MTMNKLSIVLLSVLSLLMTACLDHDNPELSPIDTTAVKITANVDAFPASAWLNPTEEVTIRVSDVDMVAPKGIVLRNIKLTNQGQTIMTKPYSGEPLEFKVPLTYMRGRLNFSIIGDLIQKNYRDAEIIIADNIQRIVFTQIPKLECKGFLNVTVKSVSTTGEEFYQWFDVQSDENRVINIPQNRLYWTPSSGTASNVDLTLGGGADTWSSNSTLESEINRISWGSNFPVNPVLRISIPNVPGSLDREKLEMYVLATYFGTTENITIEPYRLTTLFDIRESNY